MAAARRLYDLQGGGALAFSPYGWRARMALAHKGLEYERVPVGFTEKHKIAFSGQERVPVLDDGGTVVPDSWAIACHIEDAYPDRPSLFGAGAGRDLAHFVSGWADSQLIPAMARLIVPEIHANVRDEDRDYFRKTRGARFGDFDELRAKVGEHRPVYEATLAPIRLALRDRPFLSGAAPLHADYIVAGTFMWGRCSSRVTLFAEDDPIAAWFARMLDLFGGLAREAACP